MAVSVFFCTFASSKTKRMKRIIPFVLALGIMMLSACKEKKQSDDIITTKYVPKQLQDPIGMPADNQSQAVEWGGATYQVSVSRVAADSLPMVKDEAGQKYKDNRITVSVNHKDGSSLFKRTFTKSAFAQYVDEVFRKNGILASIRFDEVDNGKLEFSVVVALPDAVDDVFIPLEMTVDRNGIINIREDDDMDMLDYVEDEDEGV